MEDSRREWAERSPWEIIVEDVWGVPRNDPEYEDALHEATLLYEKHVMGKEV